MGKSKHERCKKPPRKGGRCVAHGAKRKRCTFEGGCTKSVRKGGVCWTHGAKVPRKLCTFEGGCTNKVVQGGVCITHGAMTKRCSFKGCARKAQEGGRCITHGAKMKGCSFNGGCNNLAKKGGVCIMHGAETKRCSFDGGCTRQAVKGGVCITHGAEKKRCSVEGCNKQVQKGGFCITHGAKTSTNPTNTANPPSSSTGANSTSDDTTTTTTTTTEEGEEENHGNVGDRGGDKPRPSVTMKTSSKRPTKQRKVDKQITPRKKSRAGKKRSANTDGATTKEVKESTKPSALLPNTTMHPVLHQGDGNEIESDESPAAQADDTEDCNTSYDNYVFKNEESDEEGNMNDAMDDDATEGANQEDATEDVTEDDVTRKTTKSTLAAASDLPVGVETQAESAQPPHPQELPTCNNESCNGNVFRDGFCIEHLLAETDKKLEAVAKELEEYKMAETRAAEDKKKLLEAEARVAEATKTVDEYKKRAALDSNELAEAKARAEEAETTATAAEMKLAEATKTVDEYKKRAAEAQMSASEVEARATEVEMRATVAEMKLAEATKTVDEYKKRATEAETSAAKANDLREGPRQDDADEEETKLRSALSKAIVTEKPNVKWEDVAGLESAKKLLKVTIIMPRRFPSIFTGNRKPYKGILLYGPPGTGEHLSQL